jgi:hypothetical protein
MPEIREFSIPCVVGFKTGSHALRTGHVAEVDGGLGWVTRVECGGGFSSRLISGWPALTALERQHRSPKARVEPLVRFLAEQANSIAQSAALTELCPRSLPSIRRIGSTRRPADSDSALLGRAAVPRPGTARRARVLPAQRSSHQCVGATELTGRQRVAARNGSTYCRHERAGTAKSFD